MFRISVFMFVILKRENEKSKIIVYLCDIIWCFTFFIKNIRIFVFVYYFILKNISVYFCLQGKWETKKFGSPSPSNSSLRTTCCPIAAMLMCSPSPLSRSLSPFLLSTSSPLRPPSPLCPLKNE